MLYTLSCIITTDINIFCSFLATTVEIIIVSLIHTSKDYEIIICHCASPVVSKSKMDNPDKLAA
jgi:hypothetical protein